MKALYKVRRINGVLLAKMYTNCKDNWFAANRPIANAKEGKVAFAEFVEDIRNENKVRT